MTDFIDKLVRVARAELATFKNGQLSETSEETYRRVGDYWSLLELPYDGRTEVKNRKGKLFRPAWSAAFISWCMDAAGAELRFEGSQAHCHYVDAAMRAKDENDASVAYWAFDSEERAPQIGDLICAGREYADDFDYEVARMAYKADSFYPSHADIVVDLDLANNLISVIGGNVGQSVSLTRVKVGDDGRLAPHLGTDKQVHPWISVLACRL